MSESTAAGQPRSQRLRRAVANAWLALFFWLCDRAPILLNAVRPAICAAVFRLSPSVRNGTRANARRLLGPQSSRIEQDRLAYRTIDSFFRFCCEMGNARHATIPQLLSHVERVSGEEHYHQARSARRGVIVVTGHMGSFEVAIARLRSLEEHVHVLFKRDAVEQFERQRAELRRRLGIHEALVEEGWPVWIKLRDALLADQVVVIQGDRVLAGQKGQLVPFLDGHIEIPPGPVTLAMVSGAPIVPIFSIRTSSNKIQVIVEQAIHVAPDSSVERGSPHPALLDLARVIQKQILAFPDQWLVLEPAWKEDQGGIISKPVEA